MTDLRCERLVDPLGVGEPAPRLSWRLEADRPGILQRACRVVITSTAGRYHDPTHDLWDSGIVETDVPALLYGGRALCSRERCTWRVEVWGDDCSHAVSGPAVWEMGLLDPGDWQARWIRLPWGDVQPGERPCPILRRRFHLTLGPVRAHLYVTALGLHWPAINGGRTSRSSLRPGLTDYRQRLRYHVDDVTVDLHQGDNVIEIDLAEGWYSGRVGFHRQIERYGRMPEVLAQLEVELSDGTVVTISTDASWEGAFGWWRRADLLLGETFDATRDPTEWRPVELGDGTPAELVSARLDGARLIEAIDPVVADDVAPGQRRFDLGQNIAGWSRVWLRGDRGERIVLRHAEVLEEDGSLHTANLRDAHAIDRYTLRGGGEETWEPSFTTHGFRYVEVTGPADVVATSGVVGQVVHTPLERTGWFRCSNDVVNRLHENIVWSQRANSIDLPTDCPQRDERLGWLEDMWGFAPTACFSFDVSVFLDRWLDEVDGAQSPEGAFPDVAPLADTPINRLHEGAPGWGDAGVGAPWTLWEWYGDARVLERHYPAMARWVEFVVSNNPQLLWLERRGHDYGDWLGFHESPREVIATAYFARSAELVARAATVLGRSDDASRYGHLADAIRAAFAAAYVDGDGQVRGDTQCVYALALRFELVSADLRARVAAHLARTVRDAGAPTTGYLGTGHLLPALTEAGYIDLAYGLLLREDMPSWLYPVLHGATTMWERWDGWWEERGLNEPWLNSFNHVSFGTVGEWLHATVGGLAPDPAQPGWANALVRPRPGGDLTWGEARYASVRGEFACRWERDEDGLDLTVTVPAGATATVEVPSADGVGVSRVVQVGSGVHNYRG